MSLAPQALDYQLRQLSDSDHYVVAYSGGIDSHVLLHLCAQLKNSPNGYDRSFSAVYIDHGLSPHSAKWGEHCQSICFQLDIPLQIIKVDAHPLPRQSPESAARSARYQALKKVIKPGQCLLVAQHLSDQAETFLLQLFRGAGVKGLSAMPRVKPFGAGYLARPLLAIHKNEILAYARLHQLDWVDDESNQYDTIDRNLVRRKITPVIEKRWPAVLQNIARSAQLQAEAQQILDSVAREDIALREAAEDNAYNSPRLNIQWIQELAPERLRNVLRFWLSSQGAILPSKKILEQICLTFIESATDAMPVVKWKWEKKHYELRRFHNTLYLLAGAQVVKAVHPADTSVELPSTCNAQRDIVVPFGEGAGKLLLRFIPGKQAGYGADLLNYEKLKHTPLQIRFRQGGEKFCRGKGQPHQSVKNLLRDLEVPPWLRDKIPLIYQGDILIQVGNFTINQEFFASSNEHAFRIDWLC